MVLSLTWQIVQRLDGSPAAVHVLWSDPAGAVHSHVEHLDEGATIAEAQRCIAFVVGQVCQDPW